MNYHLSSRSMQLPEDISQHLADKLNKLAKLLPPKARHQAIDLHLHRNATHKFIEGSAELHLPGKTLTARFQDRNIVVVIDRLVAKLKHQLMTYKTTRDGRHSDFPSHQSIRKDQLLDHADLTDDRSDN